MDLPHKFETVKTATDLRGTQFFFLLVKVIKISRVRQKWDLFSIVVVGVV